MSEKLSFWQSIFRRDKPEPQPISYLGEKPIPKRDVHPLEIPPNDPLLAHVTSSPGLIEVDKLKMASPTLRALREVGVKLTLPLISQGELIGLLNLGPRMSEQEYSSDDYRLLNNLATQASPALRIAQLARQQLIEAQERERIEQELRVARVIQETLLPKEIPALEGWALAAHWQPASAVGGDFYDFIHLPNGHIGTLIADVTDKGVPAAMVMATTRSILRAVAERLVEPGQVLARTNELLYPDIPPKMFVTCLYLVLNSHTGRIKYANAGHNLPYLRNLDGVVELRATGMPLGLMPGMEYEQKETTIQPGESVLLSSDGLVEAHNPVHEMFGFPRVQQFVGEHPGGEGLIEHLLNAFDNFTGEGYEQEDDITLVTIERLPSPPTLLPAREKGANSLSPLGGEGRGEGRIRTLDEFTIFSQPGNERQAASRVHKAVKSLNLSKARRKRLETAVAEAVMNAMEHGNQYQADMPVEISVRLNGDVLVVRITDQGGSAPIPDVAEPDLAAKLKGEQSPRGWGLFLIKNMVDEMNIVQDEAQHTIELVLKLE